MEQDKGKRQEKAREEKSQLMATMRRCDDIDDDILT